MLYIELEESFGEPQQTEWKLGQWPARERERERKREREREREREEREEIEGKLDECQREKEREFIC